MKVMYIFEAGGGVRKHVSDLLKLANEPDMEIYVIYHNRTTDHIMLHWLDHINENIQVFENPFMMRKIDVVNDFKTFIMILKVLNKVKPDIVHCHSAKAGIVGRIAAAFTKSAKVVYTPHAYVTQNPDHGRYKLKFYNTVESVLLKYFTDVTINVSDGEKEFAKINLKTDGSQNVVIYNGIPDIKKNFDKDYIYNKLNIEKGKKIVGVVARMDFQKNPYEFLQIADRIAVQNDQIIFVYIGGGEMYPELKKRAGELKGGKNIYLFEHRDDVLELAACFDLYLITSLYEGLPYSLIEALYLELPVVASDTVGNNEVVIHGYNGELYQLGDVEAACTSITRILYEDTLNLKYSQNGKSLFSEKFLLEDMLMKTKKLYDDLYVAGQ